MGANYIGAPSFREVNPYGFFDHYHSDAYSSAYPNIRAISNEYMQIRPFAIDSNGKPTKHAAVEALYHPNQKDSSVSFFEKVAVSTLVNRNTYLLVWRNEGGVAKPGGDFGLGGKNIAGYTFLEHPTLSVVDNKTIYSIGSQQFKESEVIVLPGGVDPKNLYAGYSPTIAAKKWATLDDYIADFQKGFFENNAIPAGQFIITSPSKQDFADTVDQMQGKHQGAGKNNNVTYTWRPVDNNTGKALEAKVEWIPFAQSNKDIDFKSLFEQANHRLDLAFGVPQIVKGVDDAATYANAQVAEKTFSLRAVKPLALRNYTQITHELNRICNGIGVAVTFDYEIPTVADEEKVMADTKLIEATLINTMTLQGYSLDSIVDAFELSNGYKTLKLGGPATVIDNDKPDVDEGGEVEKSPDPDKIDGVSPISKVKAALSHEQQLKKIALTFMEEQIDETKDALDSTLAIASDGIINKFIDDAMDVITQMILIEGSKQTAEGYDIIDAAGLATDNIKDFNLNDNQIERYRAYLNNVAHSYSEDTTKSTQAVLDRANVEGWSKAQIKKELDKLPDLEGWRAERLARSETVRSQGTGSLYSMEQITSETGYEVVKVWTVKNSDACEFCRAMEGTEIPVQGSFVPVGGAVVGSDGTILVNNFVDVETADLHPNDTCVLTYKVK